MVVDEEEEEEGEGEREGEKKKKEKETVADAEKDIGGRGRKEYMPAFKCFTAFNDTD
jgi:hypothetical protein